MKKFDLYKFMDNIGTVCNALKKNSRRIAGRAGKLYRKNISANGGTPMFAICIAGVLIFAIVMIFDGRNASGSYKMVSYNSDIDADALVENDAIPDGAVLYNDGTETDGIVNEEATEQETGDENVNEAEGDEETQADTLPEEITAEETETQSPYADIAVTSLRIEDDYVNVRSAPSTEGEIIGKIYNECAAKIIEAVDGEAGTWYHMKSGSVTGYIKAEFFITGEAAEKKALEIGKMLGRVNAGGLRLREEPNTESEIITSLWEGEIYTVIGGDTDGFTKITLGKDDDGNEVAGFVKSEYIDTYVDFDTAVSKEEEEEAKEEAKRLKEEAERLEAEAKAKAAAEAQKTKRNAVVAYAKQFLGNPYVYGGTSLTNGTDCSGFVKSVYAHFGISLTRTSASQAGCGRRISVSDLNTGDLVFYARGSKIYHVAMYIGGGQIIHAIDESRGIGITSMYFATPYCAVTLF